MWVSFDLACEESMSVVQTEENSLKSFPLPQAEEGNNGLLLTLHRVKKFSIGFMIFHAFKQELNRITLIHRL